MTLKLWWVCVPPNWTILILLAAFIDGRSLLVCVMLERRGFPCRCAHDWHPGWIWRIWRVCACASKGWVSWHWLISSPTFVFTHELLLGSIRWRGSYVQDILVFVSMQSVTVSMSACGSDHWGSSVTGLFCLSVSMSERTPRLTLVETRRVTESAGGACEQAFWDGGRATRHFWYLNCRQRKIKWILLPFWTQREFILLQIWKKLSYNIYYNPAL